MYPEVDFLYLNEQEMIKAGVKNMPKCIDTMEDVLKCLTKGDFVMGGENHNSHGCMVTFPNESPFQGQYLWLCLMTRQPVHRCV